MDNETMFLAALLELGSVPGLKQAVTFGDRFVAAQRSRTVFDYPSFMTHKMALIAWLGRQDEFDVYYGVDGKQLTEKAALWVGEFYKWLLEKQNAQAD